MPPQSGISPPSTGQVRSGFVAMRRAPPRTACSAVFSFAYVKVRSKAITTHRTPASSRTSKPCARISACMGGSPITNTGAPGSSARRWRASTREELMTSSAEAGIPSRVSLAAYSSRVWRGCSTGRRRAASPRAARRSPPPRRRRAARPDRRFHPGQRASRDTEIEPPLAEKRENRRLSEVEEGSWQQAQLHDPPQGDHEGEGAREGRDDGGGRS